VDHLKRCESKRNDLIIKRGTETRWGNLIIKEKGGACLGDEEKRGGAQTRHHCRTGGSSSKEAEATSRVQKETSAGYGIGA